MLNKSFVRIPLQIILMIVTLPLIILAGVTVWVISLFTASPVTKGALPISTEPDYPCNFALKNGIWLAIKTQNSLGVKNALKLFTHAPANWASGLARAQQHDSGYNVFICPPIGDWTFIATSGLFSNYEDTQKFLLEFPNLAEFPQIYCFMTHSTVGYAGLIAIESGIIQRVFIQTEGYVEENFGDPIVEEQLLYGAINLKGLSTDEATVALGHYEAIEDLSAIESMQALCGKLTGIDPSTIEELDCPPSTGVIGYVAFKGA